MSFSSSVYVISPQSIGEQKGSGAKNACNKHIIGIGSPFGTSSQLEMTDLKAAESNHSARLREFPLWGEEREMIRSTNMGDVRGGGGGGGEGGGKKGGRGRGGGGRGGGGGGEKGGRGRGGGGGRGGGRRGGGGRGGGGGGGKCVRELFGLPPLPSPPPPFYLAKHH